MTTHWLFISILILGGNITRFQNGAYGASMYNIITIDRNFTTTDRNKKNNFFLLFCYNIYHNNK